MKDEFGNSIKQAEALFSLCPDLLCLADFEGYFRFLNPAWTETLGWSTDELKARPYKDFVHPDDAKNTLAAGAALRNRSDIKHFRNRYRRKNGDYIWLEWAARSDVTQPLIFAVARDMTRLIEQESTAHSLSKLVNSLKDPVFVIDPQMNFQFIYVNEATCRHYGYSRTELLTKTAMDLDPHYPLERMQQHWSEVKEKSQVVIETEHRLRTGEVVPVQVNANRIEFNQRDCIGGFIQNIGERKKAEADLRALAERLAHSNAELEQFAAVASHDLIEPLRTIASYLQLLKRNAGQEWDVRSNEYFEFVVDSVVRLRTLIQELLTYYQLGNQLPLESVDVKALVDMTISQMKESISQAEATLTLHPLPVVTGNSTLLSILFQNLIENALKYRSHRHVEICISSEPQNKEWLFQIRDNGIGIAQENLNSIFGIFKRLHTRNEFPGTGIGLAACKKIVASLGGKIWVESEPGKGSTFLFTIPRS